MVLLTTSNVANVDPVELNRLKPAERLIQLSGPHTRFNRIS